MEENPMPEMTGHERVQTAVRCEKPDRVPMIPMFGFFDARYKGVQLVDFVNDQDLARDLAFFLDLPAKTCVMNPDGMTSAVKFKEILGDHIAWMGDTPATLFAAGTPDDIYTYVREQVELFEGRGLIIAPGCDAPINTKPENMEAFVAAAHEFGAVPV
jgi:uroporphyrinogen-III decarboxylase